ncbi:MAG: TIGR00341 family protein [Nitrospirae bacterium]|nr:TIGR00341 family protein [Nitrospirota bacterium]
MPDLDKNEKGRIIESIHLDVKITKDYFLFLVIANLIALIGLIMNSTPVIIGAMLISPLMGPILGFGLSFVTEDRHIFNTSVVKLVSSVILTVAIASAATYIFPMKEVTHEIASRTTPNLLDLLIAFFCGTVGAVSLCKNKNYLTIVPGVAIATAVIPPLSVTGFGIGIMNLRIAYGGFLLFFTNFVAILISTCVVFYIFGFRPEIKTTTNIFHVKTRFMVLALILILVSIPLFYTLKAAVVDLRLKQAIEANLRKTLDVEDKSRLVSFNYSAAEYNQIDINAVINTVKYYQESDFTSLKDRLGIHLGKEVNLNIDQVLVHRGGLKEEPVLARAAPQTTPLPVKIATEDIKAHREQLLKIIDNSLTSIEKLISPSILQGYSLSFDKNNPAAAIILKIRQDSAFSPQTISIIQGLLAGSLKIPVEVTVETTPFIPPIVYEVNSTTPADGQLKALDIIATILQKKKDISIALELYPEASLPYRKRMAAAGARADALIKYLNAKYGIPVENLKVSYARKSVRVPSLKISVSY